jgi:SAM-dependent methyltransferase
MQDVQSHATLQTLSVRQPISRFLFMPAPDWTLLDAEPDERARFATLALALAHASVPAGPANRLREVRRLSADGATWYLKVFHRTQWKNALALRWSRPRARHEGEREAAMARALVGAGFAAPRIVAVGQQGPRSYVLCAALPGNSLREVLGKETSPALLLAAARHAGVAVGAGFRLPDLSADHLFVAGAGATPHFALLDLHNATLGEPSIRTLRRALRHSARSLRGLPITRCIALRAALVFLRAAGRQKLARRLLAALPPWDTHARYDVAGKSAAYHARNPARTARELALLAQVWPGQPGERVLDSPCGAGRLAAFLTARGHLTIGSDRARAMLRQPDHHRRRVCADAAALPFADGSCDGVVVFRFLHHLGRAGARAVVIEAARVSTHWLVLSVFHPWSAHGLVRRMRRALARRGPTRWSLAPRTLSRWLASQGFTLQRAAREGALRELCVLSYRRDAPTDS